MAFTLGAMAGPDPFLRKRDMHPDVKSNIEWVVNCTDEEVMDHRERVTREIEQCGARLWAAGHCADWFQGMACLGLCASRLNANLPALQVVTQ